MLEKIKTASVPDKFSQDFVASKLSMKGGTPRSIIPFMKKLGLVNSDGTPTERYREFRNPDKSAYAIAQAMKEAYAPLFEMNERAHELDNTQLRGLIVEATGAEANSTPVEKTISTFTALNRLADFNYEDTSATPRDLDEKSISGSQLITSSHDRTYTGNREGINLSYTVNLNLPASTDIEVFNAIFKSLKQHLLQE